jgi:hypothetical protein
MDETEQELERERDNGDRLAAALDTVLYYMRDEDRESLRATLICPRGSQLTVGHVIDGAQALHVRTIDKRPALY